MSDGAALPIFDGHNDSLMRLYREAPGDPGAFYREQPDGHLDLPRARRGGMAGGFFAIFVPPHEGAPERDPYWELVFHESGFRQKLRPAIDPGHARAVTEAGIDFLREIEAQGQGALRVVTERDHLARWAEEQYFAVVLHLEGAEAIREDLSNLEQIYARGVRSLGLVWSRPNAFGEGVPFCFPQHPDTGPGLTRAGQALVKECNRMGILIDLAHLNARGFWEVQRLSKHPLVVTHAGVFAICPFSRNLTDDQIDAVGASGGVIGVNFETISVREDGLPEENTPLEQIVRHVDYLVARIGIDHVALGSDFDGADMPADLKDAAHLPNLVDALRRQGYDREALEKIAWRNWLRVLNDTWSHA